jgi:hypothetical protein
MLGGLSLRHRVLVATAATALMGSFASEPVKAADLGGDCCADLEERVAELEATTVRKGNKKVSVELYGRVNRVINFWDDGSEKNVYVENMSYNTTRFGIRGKAKTGVSDVNGIYVIETEQFDTQSRFANQFNDNPDATTPLRMRKAAIGLDSKKYGRVWLGLQEMAKDNINKDTVIIKGIDQTMTQDFYMNWSFFLRPKGFNGAEGLSNIRYQDIARCYSTSSSAFDCSTRRNEARYDTPELWGFTGSASWGEDDIWSASLRYQKEWDNWKVGAGYAYEDFTDELVQNGGGGVFFQSFKRDLKEWAGSFSVLHKPTGFWVWGANSNSEDNDIGAAGFITGKAPPVMHSWDIAGGIYRDFFAPGKTTIWGGWTTDQDGLGGFNRTTVSASTAGTASSYAVWNGRIAANRIPGIGFDTQITGSETNKWYVAIDQAFDSAALDLYVAYQHIDPSISLVTNAPAFSPTGKIKNVPIELDDFDLFFAGGRIQF